jgi:DNA-binding CsgD family transcriptional regulator
MKCLETRRRPDGLKVRRYRTDEGVTVRTIEIPIEVFRAVIRADRFDARVAAHKRAIETKTKRERALAMLAAGVKPVAIANDLGVTEKTVYKYRRSICLTS